MSDARLRGLERQAATGDLEARARLLLERERLGHLTRAQLALAAHAGDAAAVRALGVGPPDDAQAWARGFYRFGQHTCVRVVAAATATLLERGPALLRRGELDGLAALSAVRPWLACPCDTHAAPAVHLAQQRPFEVPSLPGLVLGVAWVDDAPAFTLRGGLSRAEAERARAGLLAVGGAADVTLGDDLRAGEQTWTLRLRERFPPPERVALVRQVRRASGLGLSGALGGVEGVNAVVRALHDASQGLGLEAVRDAVREAVVPAAARA